MENVFIERKEPASLLIKRVIDFNRGYRQNVGLIGKQNTGKTYLICSLLKYIETSGLKSIIPVYVEVRPEPIDYFAKRLMGSLLKSFIKYSGFKVPDSFDLLVMKSRKYIPLTIQKMRNVRNLLFKGNRDEAFAALMKLTGILANETGKNVLFVIDEFDKFSGFGVKDVFSVFSHEIMIQKSTMYLVSSSNPGIAKNIFREKLSLLFGNFESIEVGSFSYRETKKYVSSILDGKEAGEHIVKFLHYITGGNLYYLQVVLSVLKMRTDSRVIEEAELIDVLKFVMYDEKSVFYQYFISSMAQFSKGNNFYLYLNILAAIALGKKKLNFISSYVERPKDEVKKNLQKLADAGIVSKVGAFYIISDKFMRFWLEYVIAPGLSSLDPCSFELESRFERNVLDYIDTFCYENYKSVAKRVEEVLRNFSNDIVEIGDKKFKCPSFKEVFLRPSNGRVYPLYAKSYSSRWLCQVAENYITENDVQVLINDAGKSRLKVTRKILVAPYGISYDALLMAKEGKIDIWDIERLNLMFDLYGKCEIIV